LPFGNCGFVDILLHPKQTYVLIKDMEIKGFLVLGRQIWGDEKLNLSQVIVRMGKVFGDICRWERGEKASDRPDDVELKKELGNMIFSGICWCDNLGFDPEECVNFAVEAQKKYQNVQKNKTA
jgi:hypothetical protein